MEKKKLNLNAIKHPVINNLQDDKKEEDIYKRSENEETKTLDDNIVKESGEKEELINEDEISQKDNILIEKENGNEENENEEKKGPAIKISFASIKKNQNLDTTNKNNSDEEKNKKQNNQADSLKKQELEIKEESVPNSLEKEEIEDEELKNKDENENEEKKGSAIKISFASIKKDQNLDTTSKNNSDEEKNKKEESVPNSLEKEEIEDDDEVSEKKDRNKISFASIKKNQNLDTTSKNSDDEKDKNLKNSLEEKKSDDEDKVIIHKKDDNLKDLFGNYESKFEKDKKTIIEKLKKLKVIPKTRLGFLFSLTIITIIGISVLFYIDPKTHSIENYKVSLLNIFNGNKTSNEDSTDLVVNNTGSSEEVKIEKISVGGYAFEISVKDVKGEEKIYIYNMKLYKDKKVLLNQLNKVVETLKKEKLINILSEKYSKEK